jgi:hypothetical protein
MSALWIDTHAHLDAAEFAADEVAAWRGLASAASRAA